MHITKEQRDILLKYLEGKGYRKTSGHYRNEQFGYWKSFGIKYDSDGDKSSDYQLAILFWDFSIYSTYNQEDKNCIGVQYEFLLGNNNSGIDRLDLTICDDKFTIDEFELFCQSHYQFCEDIMNDILFRRESL